jgi:WD40 repeat protein
MRAWVGLGLWLTAAAGCNGLTKGEPLSGGGKLDPGAARRDAATGGIMLGSSPDADTGRGTADGAVDAGAVDGGAATCAPTAAPDHPLDLSPTPNRWAHETSVPFSCDPLPGAFFFPRPDNSVPGGYARCASFADAVAQSLAVSFDGARVALIGSDGIARIVDVATHTVVGVLAPPRASLSLAAFSPAGDTILTVAKGERVVTLWEADNFAPLWSATLPGHPYSDTWTGAASFSPDGKTALVSPGADLFLFDVASGATLASRPSSSVLQASYGWNGRRIAVLEAPIAGMCAHGPFGGTVTILDPGTLAPLATPITWPLTGDESPPPGQMLAAAAADLLLTTSTQDSPNALIQAFRLSDGSPLPAFQIASFPFPLALTPDGTGVVRVDGSRLELQRLDDGAAVASADIQGFTALAMSADGSTIAAGSRGPNLLGVWHPGVDNWTATCSADLKSSGSSNLALSADGQIVAVGWGTELRLMRRSDGSVLSTIAGSDKQPLSSFWLSPDGQDAIVDFQTAMRPYTVLGGVYRTSDGAELLDLGGAGFTGCGQYVFRGGDTAIDMLCSPPGGGASTLPTVDLTTGTASRTLSFEEPYMALAGLSADCDVVSDVQRRVVWRACGDCSDPPFATGTSGGVLSRDGSVFLGQDDNGTELNGVTLWQVLPGGAVIHEYPPRAEEPSRPSEYPVAVSTHGDRVITGAHQVAPCSEGPLYTSRVHVVADGTVPDELPPNITAASDDLNILAFGPVLWCAR